MIVNTGTEDDYILYYSTRIHHARNMTTLIDDRVSKPT